MADERLVLGLSAWLRDSDIPPPDAQMSASRVMAGVEVTERLGHFWPPLRLAPRVEPAPTLGAFGPEGPPPRPVPRIRKPLLKARLREVLTPVRLLAVSVVVALTCSTALITASLLPGDPPGRPLAAVAPVAAPATPAPTATPRPTPTPEPTWRPSEHVLDWHTDSVRLEADAISVALGNTTFMVPGDVETAGSVDVTSASLDGGWFEAGVEQRLVIEIAADEWAWWVERIRTYDGRPTGRWIEFEGLADRTRTPLGASWTGDLAAPSTGAERKAFRQRGAATLTMEGLRLSAFGPEGVPPAG